MSATLFRKVSCIDIEIYTISFVYEGESPYLSLQVTLEFSLPLCITPFQPLGVV
jgi:hypothetical protein